MVSNVFAISSAIQKKKKYFDSLCGQSIWSLKEKPSTSLTNQTSHQHLILATNLQLSLGPKVQHFERSNARDL